jgi:hypothetical protein
LEGAKEGFARDGVEEKRFERSGEVDVYAINPERFVVGEVVGL